MNRRINLMSVIEDKLEHAYQKHGRESWGRHEFYGIIKEELDELWDAIKSDAPQSRVLLELLDVAAMWFRYYETGDRYRGDHPLLCSFPFRCEEPATH